MDDDQQFCLRWNNHQSTLVAVFDTLLENGTLVDCTLAAEGKCLNAHKVVLSACSPYFEALLSKHFDKHPILILKDVKFQELKAMMDYMYRGEVNISQDQLGALLKAAESLQIKGLSDNRKGETSDRKPTPAAPPPKSPQPASTLPKVQGLTIEQRAREDSREGSMSPGPRKKKRLRRKSEELDNHDASNSSESHSLPAQSIPMLPAITKMNADVPDQVETKSEILTRHKQIEDTIPQVPIIKEKIETHTELMLEPKSEYVDEMNEDSIEDLTLDDDDLSNMEQVDDQAGPSHGAGEGSSQGFGGWHMGNQSQDEVFLAAQEAVGAHRDSQGYMEGSSGSSDVTTPNHELVCNGNNNEGAKKRKRTKQTYQSMRLFNTKRIKNRCSKCASFVNKEINLCRKCDHQIIKENFIILPKRKSNKSFKTTKFRKPDRASSRINPSIGSDSLKSRYSYDYGPKCEPCILLKETNQPACENCHRNRIWTNNSENESGQDALLKIINTNTENETGLERVNTDASNEANNNVEEDNNDDGSSDEMEYVSLNDLLAGNVGL
ncbi:longitudinals lacking protein, isoforms H/M/V-like isoform X3 [Diorhabda sublineata]|uniref:longitudinals lacking protein, isoforms H/M/V-like isoform X3 n=1 Tax=Diorhabda sublineata TaxID=1163346 RepID=UPI0024E145E0|nr:longitudinals lacking protein, isoforms H/M/V-like isoform X3 [Diorhabda sublineata]